MGPSGAVKSSLLETLLYRTRNLKVSGSFSLNGQPASITSLHKQDL